MEEAQEREREEREEGPKFNLRHRPTDRPWTPRRSQPRERGGAGRRGRYISGILSTRILGSPPRGRELERVRRVHSSGKFGLSQSWERTEEGHATARNFSDTPFLRDKPNLCQSRVCRPLSFCPQKEESEREDEDIMLLPIPSVRAEWADR